MSSKVIICKEKKKKVSMLWLNPRIHKQQLIKLKVKSKNIIQ